MKNSIQNKSINIFFVQTYFYEQFFTFKIIISLFLKNSFKNQDFYMYLISGTMYP